MNVFIDGDLKRIYEVPDGSTYTLNSDGYRVYTQGNGGLISRMSHVFIWSRFVDFRKLNTWALEAFDRSGGAFRYTDENSVEFSAQTDLRLINGYQLVPANYPHQWIVEGNLYDELDLGKTFDLSTVSVLGVNASINFAESGMVAIVEAGASSSDSDKLNTIDARVREIHRKTP